LKEEGCRKKSEHIVGWKRDVGMEFLCSKNLSLEQIVFFSKMHGKVND
jgi:hypothetical protein